MIEKNDTFNDKIGREEYDLARGKYSNYIAWEKLAPDVREMYIAFGLQKHQSENVEAFRASLFRRRNYNKE